MSDLQIPFIDFAAQRQRIGNEVKEAVGRVIDTQQFILNRQVSNLETQVAMKLGSKFAIRLITETGKVPVQRNTNYEIAEIRLPKESLALHE